MRRERNDRLGAVTSHSMTSTGTPHAIVQSGAEVFPEWDLGGVNGRARPDICIIKGLSVGVKAASELTAS